MLTIETIIVNGVVIANGIADSDGDILTKKDIKTIFMKYNNETDTMHTQIKNDGVEVFANWISEVDTLIDGKTVPSGSWLVSMKVTNPNLIQCLQNGKLNGFSLGSVSDKAFTPKYWFINKSLTYSDIKDIEEVIPLYISFVDKPANQYGLEILSYTDYINKNEKDVKSMTEETKEEMISISALERVKDLFGINKSEEQAEQTETVETEQTSTDETVTALFEKLDTIIEQNKEILDKLNQEEEVVDEEENIEKAEEKEEDETEETSEEKKDEEVEKAETSEEEDKDKEEEDEVHVDKRETSMIENQNTSTYTTFYHSTGRDHLGRKIRK